MIRKIIYLPYLILLTNCATVVRGTSEPFKVFTEPPGANVTTTLETKDSIAARKINPELKPAFYGCQPTPCEITLPRRSKFIARIEHEGYDTVRVIVRSKTKLDVQAANSLGTTATVGSATTVGTASVGATSAGIAAAGIIGAGAIYASPLIFTDAVSGATLSLYPNPVSIRLNPADDVTNKNYDLDELTDPNQTYTNFLDPHNNYKKPQTKLRP